MVDLRAGFAAMRLVRCASSTPPPPSHPHAFFTLQPWHVKGVLVADRGPSKFFMRLHHPLLPGEEPCPSDRDVYLSKLRRGAPVLVSGDSLRSMGWSKSRTIDDKAKGFMTDWRENLDNVMGYATNWNTIIGTLQGPGSEPKTFCVRQDGGAGESFTVHVDALQAGSRERIIMGPGILLQDLEWEVRMMWPSVLQKVSFEVGGKIMDGGSVGISEIRAGRLVVRLAEASPEPSVGQPAFVTADPDHYERTCKESGLSWPYTERGGPRTERMGQHGSVTKVDLSNNTVELSNGIRWVPIRSLVGFEHFTGQAGGTRPEVSVPCRADPSYSPSLFTRLFG